MGEENKNTVSIRPTRKGEEAENVAIVFYSIYDINMVSNNNKLDVEKKNKTKKKENILELNLKAK